MTSRVYALANQKGGVGKTTTAINMAACVAEAGTPVLLIDLDPQANATTGLGYRPDELEASSYDLLHGRPLDEVLVDTDVDNLWLVPSHPDLAHWSVPDPALAGANDRASYPAFERTASELETRIAFLLTLLDQPSTIRRSTHAER